MIYLDNGATSFFKPQEVKNAVAEAMEKYVGNAGRGGYKVSQDASMRIMEARELCVSFFGEEYDCIFTPSCSYALNLAIRGFVRPHMDVITTYLEHNSVLRNLESLRRAGIISYTVLHDLSERNIVKHIKNNTGLIITTHVSNVTGELVDTKMISEICKKYNIKYLLDTAQGAGHVQCDKTADMVAFAGHKGFKGLIGIGGLMKKKDVKLNPVFFGGTGTSSLSLLQPTDFVEDYEVGSQSGVLISSLYAGMKYTIENQVEIIEKEKFLTRYLMNKLNQFDFLEKYYDENNCHSVLSFNIKNLDSSLVADILNEDYDICVRAGFHCAPIVHAHYNTSSTGMVRVSLNEQTSCAEINELVFAIEQIAKKIKI